MALQNRSVVSLQGDRTVKKILRVWTFFFGFNGHEIGHQKMPNVNRNIVKVY